MTLPNPVPGVGVSPPIVYDPHPNSTPFNVVVERATVPVMSVPMIVALDHATGRVRQVDVGAVDGAGAVARDHVAPARLTHDVAGRVVDADASPAVIQCGIDEVSEGNRAGGVGADQVAGH